MRAFDLVCLVYLVIILSGVPKVVHMALEERQTCSDTPTEEEKRWI